MENNNVEFIFEKLEVYKRSLNFSIKICKICSDFPIKYSRISNQFIGASVSIPLNIAEGNGRDTNKDKVNFYRIAKGSGFECVPLIAICFSLNLISKQKEEEFRNDVKEITQMISGLIKYQKNKI